MCLDDIIAARSALSGAALCWQHIISTQLLAAHHTTSSSADNLRARQISILGSRRHEWSTDRSASPRGQSRNLLLSEPRRVASRCVSGHPAGKKGHRASGALPQARRVGFDVSPGRNRAGIFRRHAHLAHGRLPRGPSSALVPAMPSGRLFCCLLRKWGK